MRKLLTMTITEMITESDMIKESTGKNFFF